MDSIAGTEHRIGRESAGIHRRAVAQRMDAGDGEWKFAALLAKQLGQSARPRYRIR